MNEPTHYTKEKIFDVPVLFLLFNRPSHASEVLNRIRLLKPAELFIAVDGPRPDRRDDQENVQQCLELLNDVDWPCTVRKLVREHNLGCKKAVSSAIDWFFDQVDYGIILEDDCLPDPSFFEFCKITLIKYRDNYEVMHIGGSNVYKKKVWSEDTYFFSIIPHIWGWATWRRAWKLYDVTMNGYPQFKDSFGIEKIVTYTPSISYWRVAFDNTYTSVIDTWDYQWVYTIWKNKGLCVIPNQNLVTNIGFDGTGTHTLVKTDVANMPTTSIISNQIKHPPLVKVNEAAVVYAFRKLYRLPSWFQNKIHGLKKRLNIK